MVSSGARGQYSAVGTRLTLGTRHIIQARLGNGLLDGQREGLEGRFGPAKRTTMFPSVSQWLHLLLTPPSRSPHSPMMIILPPQTINMQRNPSSHRKAMKHMRDHLTTQIPNLFPLQPQLSHTVWPRGDVQDGPRKGLIEGCMAGTVALDSLDGAKG